MFTKHEIEILILALRIDITSDHQPDKQKIRLLAKLERLIDNYENIN